MLRITRLAGAMATMKSLTRGNEIKCTAMDEAIFAIFLNFHRNFRTLGVEIAKI